jgi:predicted dehydrogenase
VNRSVFRDPAGRATKHLSSVQSITVAIIGLGAVVGNVHMRAYLQLHDKVRVVAGCDPHRGAREYAHEKWRVPKVFDNARDMIEETRPDVVAVCTPPVLHHEHTLLALHYGCHVFCEKPLATSLEEADEIIQASEKLQRLVVVNNQFSCMKIHRAAKELVGSPQFGKLLYLHARHTMCPTEFTEAGWRGDLSRRLCYEFGVHIFDLVRFFFDDTPVKLVAHMPNPSGTRADMINVVSVEFADGRGATLVLDRLSRGPERYLDLLLDGESAVIHTSIGGEVRFEAGIYTRERRPFVGFTFVKGGKAILQRGNKSKLIAKDGINPFGDATARHFLAFVEAIRNGGHPPGHARDNRKTLALVFAAYDSAVSGKVIEMSQYTNSAITC